MNCVLVNSIKDVSGGILSVRLSLVTYGDSPRSGLSENRRPSLYGVDMQARNKGGGFSVLPKIIPASSTNIKRDIGYLRGIGIETPPGWTCKNMEREA